MEDLQKNILFISNEISLNEVKLKTLKTHGSLPFVDLSLYNACGENYAIKLNIKEKQDLIDFLNKYFENKNKELLIKMKELLNIAL